MRCCNRRGPTAGIVTVIKEKPRRPGVKGQTLLLHSKGDEFGGRRGVVSGRMSERDERQVVRDKKDELPIRIRAFNKWNSKTDASSKRFEEYRFFKNSLKFL